MDTRLVDALRNLAEKRSTLRSELGDIVARNAEGMSAEDLAAFDQRSAEVKDLDERIASIRSTIERDAKVDEARNIAAAGAFASNETAELRSAGDVMRSFFEAALATGQATLDTRAQVVGTPSKGGATVKTTVSATIIERVDEISGMAGLVDTITTTSAEPLAEIIETNTLEANWVGEAQQIPASDLTYAVATLNAYKLTALTYFSVEIVTASAIDIESRVKTKQAEKIAAKLDKAILVGTGVNQPKGLYVDATTGVVVADEDVLTYENLVALKHSVAPRFRKNATWILTPEAALSIELLKDDNGRPLFRDSVAGEEYGTLLGRPYTIQEDAPRVGFGDLKAAYKLRRVANVETETSKDFKFDTAQLATRSILFADGRTADPQAFRVAASA